MVESRSPSVKGETDIDKRTLFIQNLSYSTTDEKLEEFFSSIGPVRKCFTVKPKGSNQHKGIGYVQFALNEDSIRAIETKNEFLLNGRKIKLDFAKKRETFNERRPRVSSETIESEFDKDSNSLEAENDKKKVKSQGLNINISESENSISEKKIEKLDKNENMESQNGKMEWKETKLINFKKEKVENVRNSKDENNAKANDVNDINNKNHTNVKSSSNNNNKIDKKEISNQTSEPRIGSKKQKPARTVIFGSVKNDEVEKILIKMLSKFDQSETRKLNSLVDLSIHDLANDGCTLPALSVAFDSIKVARKVVTLFHGAKINEQVIWARQFGGEGSKWRKHRLILRNLPFDVNEKEIRKYFSPIGFLWEIKIPKNEENRGRGFAFISFTSKSEAEKAILSKNGNFFRNRPIAIDWALKKDDYEKFISSKLNNEKKDNEIEIVKGEEEEDDDEEEEDNEDEGEEGEEEDEEEEEGEDREGENYKGKEKGNEGNEKEDEKEKERKEEGKEDDTLSELDMMKSILNKIMSSNQKNEKKKKRKNENNNSINNKETKEEEEEDVDLDYDDDEEEEEEEEEGEEEEEEEELLEKNNENLNNNKNDNNNSNDNSIFIRNIPLSCQVHEIRKFFGRFGEISSCRLVTDPITKRSRGTAFLEFKNNSSAKECIEIANKKGNNEYKNKNNIKKKDNSSNNVNDDDFYLNGNLLKVGFVVDKKEVEKIKNKKKIDHSNDKRNLYLLDEGKIPENSAVAKSMSKSDLEKRRKLSQEKETKLRSPKFMVSKTRLAIHNLPKSMDEKKLKQLFIDAVKKKATKQNPVIKHVKVLREEDKVDEAGNPRSKGFGFVQFEEHQHAIVALRMLNNNPDVFGSEKRPIVEFSIENKSIIEKLNNIKKERELKLKTKGKEGEKEGFLEKKRKWGEGKSVEEKKEGEVEEGKKLKKMKDFKKEKENNGGRIEKGRKGGNGMMANDKINHAFEKRVQKNGVNKGNDDKGKKKRNKEEGEWKKDMAVNGENGKKRKTESSGGETAAELKRSKVNSKVNPKVNPNNNSKNDSKNNLKNNLKNNQNVFISEDKLEDLISNYKKQFSNRNLSQKKKKSNAGSRWFE